MDKFILFLAKAWTSPLLTTWDRIEDASHHRYLFENDEGIIWC